jgi:methylated-DNA-protein-cysteine methyltransferase-like protein
LKKKTGKYSINFYSDKRVIRSDIYEKIYLIVRSIPHGKVATYGQIAKMAGVNGQARLVGYALHSLPEHSNVPWHRVINRFGKISLSQSGNDSGTLQRNILESEGVYFNLDGSVDLQRYQWYE